MARAEMDDETPRAIPGVFLSGRGGSMRGDA
jgi:hypothetical protein